MRGAKKCTAPQPGDAFCMVDVGHQPRIVLTFDRPLSQTSDSPRNYSIASGSIESVAVARARIDPVERAAVLVLDSKLAASTEYRLIIKSDPDPRYRLTSIEGVGLDAPIVVRLTTGAMPGEVDTNPEFTTADPCGAIKLLTSKCTGGPCHGATNVAPAMGLSLVTYAAIEATARGKGSALVQTAQHPPPGSVPSNDFPYGLSIVEPGSSARSFLIYKLMMDDSREEPFASVAKDLRRRIPGSEMPPRTLAGGDPSGFGPLPVDELRQIRRWIDDGAKDCPDPGGDAGADSMTDASTDSASDAGGDG
jgi:hypothetical protein